MIVVKGLYKDFAEVKVLKDIDCVIEEGEKIVIIGPSGSGKSTFLRCLNLLDQPTRGKIFIEGEEITSKDCNINKVRQKMGMVFQHFNLFPHLTVKENITLAPLELGLLQQAEAEKTALDLLEHVGVSDNADVYPGKLSGGQ